MSPELRRTVIRALVFCVLIPMVVIGLMASLGDLLTGKIAFFVVTGTAIVGSTIGALYAFSGRC